MPWISSGSRMMSSIRWRGSSDAYGSWKTTWISRRRRNQRSRDAPAMSSPSNRIWPPVGRSSPSTSRPNVVLPEPDSPTIPSVVPGLTESDTPATA